MTRQQIEVIVAMYKNGDSYAGISRAINKSEYKIKQWVKENRIEYSLEKRRNLADKFNNALSPSAWDDSKWNLERGLELIKRRWA